MDSRPLSNTIGAVLDPIFSIRRRIRIAPGATVRVAYWTIAAASREALLDGVNKHRDATAFTRASTLAWTQGQVQLHHLGVTAGEASLFQRLAGHVIYAAPAMRPSSGDNSSREWRAIRFVVAGHFRRSADRPTANRGHREPRYRARASCRPTNIGG